MPISCSCCILPIIWLFFRPCGVRPIIISFTPIDSQIWRLMRSQMPAASFQSCGVVMVFTASGETGHTAAKPITSCAQLGAFSGSTVKIGSIEYMAESWPMFQKSTSCHCMNFTGSIFDLPKNEPWTRSTGSERIGTRPLQSGFLMMPRISSGPA
jgi:hypothetical protein